MVLVWAPGTDFYSRKRREIIERLKEHGIQAFTSEELSKKIQPKLPLPEQELLHWQAADAVIVLEADVAPAMELATFYFFPEFCEKCIVVHPKRWDPSRQTTFPSEVLKAFTIRLPYAPKEMKECTITEWCVEKATNLRRAKALPKTFPEINLLTSFF